MHTLLILAAACVGCAPLTDNVKPVASTAYARPLATQLGRTASSAAGAHSSESGFLVLDTGTDALLERASLIEAAEQSIDLQYYIWNSDATGCYLASRVYAAAERGVRVRVLLDDFNVGERDAVLVALDAHPRVEVRLYNPLARGSARRSLGMIRDFSRVNRRMHNKLLTADGAATIIGGRNIGDEYFDASHELNFRDRDLLAIGPVVEQMGRAFDEFWNSERAQPIDAVATEQLTAADWERRRERAAEQLATLTQLHYELPRDSTSAFARFTASMQQLVWAPARLVVDDPATAEGSPNTAPQPVALALRELAAAAEHDVLIESAYLIPGDAALELLTTLHGRGVRLRALTNSLASNDLATNHSGYARRRKQMLLAGVELHELRPDAASCATLTPDRCAQGAALGLHSKSVVFDRRIVFVGSFNVNLRSAFLNTETALIIDSPALAQQVAGAIEQSLRAENSWAVSLDERQRLHWTTGRDGKLVQSEAEPQTGWWRRTVSRFYSLLPLERYL